MANDFLTLGGLVFSDWSTPSQMPFGGEHMMAVHRLPGGQRVVDTLGPSESDIQFRATVFENDAYEFTEALDALRIGGAQVPLTFAGRYYLVIVRHVKIDIHRFPQLVAYDVSCLVTNNQMAGNLGSAASTVTSLVSADLATAMSISGL
jgi:hypothetical protein